VGSYLKRHPEQEVEGKVPNRFDEPVVEFFLKTTKGGLKAADGTVLIEGLDPLKGEEDPFIANPEEDTWKLVHPKKTADDAEADLGRSLARASVVPTPEAIAELTAMMRNTFLTIEKFFSAHDFKFVDLKIEFGVTEDGRLVVADVIDNDSWRLRDQNWNDVSKQSFRDGEDMATIEDKYQLVASLLDTRTLS
jgi:phosphoribosylaminoimidazole-succinocarboxamide synthase